MAVDQVVPFEQDAVKEYLDKAITNWRKTRDDKDSSVSAIRQANHYVDAFQSMRMSLFGELLGDPNEGVPDDGE